MDCLPPQITHATMERVPALDGTELAVRVFGRAGKHGPVIMMHGLQSHSGWFAHSQSFLAHLGFPALDQVPGGAE